MGCGIDARARTAIDGHVRLLLAWNDAINLTAIRDPAAIAIRHVADSLTAARLFRERGIDRFVDLGSGGGFPGLTLAAALPADRALVVDSVGKKVRFLATVIEATGLDRRVAALTARAEELAAGPTDRGRWPAVTARAVGSLAELVELALPLLQPRGILVAWKRDGTAAGGGLRDEVGAARRALAVIDPGAHLTVEGAIVDVAPRRSQRAGLVLDSLATLADHRLVVIERGPGRIDRMWPRDPASRRRQGW